MEEKMDKNIGMIGLGVMGFPMAKNILKAGYRLTVYDINKEAIKKIMTNENVTEASSPKELASNVNTIVLMLPNSPHVESVIMDEHGLFEVLTEDSLIIDMSSIAPEVTKRLAKRVREKGATLIDAPVSGGETGAINGLLTIMVGSDEKDFNKILPLMETMGKNIVHCGDVGSGQVVKVVNQLMSAINMVGMAEGFTLGVKAGVNPEIMHRVISKGSGRSWAVEDRLPLVMEGHFNPGFTIDLHAKDMQIAVETARDLKVPVYGVALAYELFKTAQVKGYGKLDNCALVKVYEDLVGIEIRK